MKKICLLIFLTLFAASSASAQLLVSPHTKALKGELDLIATISIAEIEYEADIGEDFDVDRFILGVGGVYGLNEFLDIYLELGFSLESELNSGNDDTGIVIGTGLKGVVYRQDRFSVIARGGARFIDEDYGNGGDGTIVDLELGAIGRYALQNNFVIYGGVDLYPISEGEIGDIDIERESIIGLRAGAAYRFDAFSVNGEIGILGEEGFMIRAKFPLP